jgi:hypothetical protein
VPRHAAPANKLFSLLCASEHLIVERHVEHKKQITPQQTKREKSLPFSLEGSHILLNLSIGRLIIG